MIEPVLTLLDLAFLATGPFLLLAVLVLTFFQARLIYRAWKHEWNRP